MEQEANNQNFKVQVFLYDWTSPSHFELGKTPVVRAKMVSGMYTIYFTRWKLNKSLYKSAKYSHVS